MAPHSGKMSTADETTAANNNKLSEEVETKVTEDALEVESVASTSGRRGGRPCPDVLTITESNNEIQLPITYTTPELRGVIRFLSALGAVPAEIDRHLKTVYGKAMSDTTVRYWCRYYRNGHSSVDNEKKNGRPRKVNLDQPDKSAKVLNYIKTHRHAGHRDIGYHMNLAWAAAYKFIKNRLKYNMYVGCWVPIQLSQENKEERLQFSTVNLARCKSESLTNFIDQIVVADQTWMYFHTTPRNKPVPPLKNKNGKVIKCKQYQLCLNKKAIERIQTNRRRWTLEAGPSPGFSLLMTVLWDYTGLLAIDFKEPQELPQDRFRYSDKSSLEMLTNQVATIRPEVVQTGLTLLMNEDLSSEEMEAVDEAGETITSRLTSLGWQGLFNPANSPDLAPSDYHLFPPLKKHVCRKRFVDADTAKRYVLKWLLVQDPDFFATGLQELVTRWERCIELKGDYLDKGLTSDLPAQSDITEDE